MKLFQIVLLLHGEQIVTLIWVVSVLTFSALFACIAWLVYGILQQRKKALASKGQRNDGDIATSQSEIYKADISKEGRS